MKRLLATWLLLLLVALSAMPLVCASAEAPLKFGVLAFRPKVQAIAQWQPLASHLQTALGRPVVLTVYDLPELEAAVASKALDVVFTTPSHFILLQHRYQLSAPLATQITREEGHGLSSFGGVIFARADAANINTLTDLTGKQIAVTSTDFLGGFQMQAFEMLEAGMTLPDPDELLCTGMPQDRVIDAVLAGHAQVGFVRSGVLEALAHEGKLDMNRIKLIAKKSLPTFPYASATRLYPEWPVAVMPQVDELLARRLAVALLQLPADSAAARGAGIYGFTVAADYSSVQTLLRRLRMPPFDAPAQFTFADLLRQYVGWIIVLLGFLVLVFAGAGAWLILQNRRIKITQEECLLQSQRVSEVIWGTHTGTWEWNVQTGDIVLNERWADIIGYTLAELAPINIDTWMQRTHPDDLKHSSALVERCFKRDIENYKCEMRVRHKNGDWVWVLNRGRVVQWSADGKPMRMCGTQADITDRKAAQARMELAAIVFGHAKEGIMITDANAQIIEVNATFTDITGYSHEDAVGRKPNILQSGRQGPEFYAVMWRDLTTQGFWTGEIWNQRKSGEVYAEILTISAVRDDAGHIKNYVAVFADITALKEHAQQLEHIAHNDALTGLPNRVLLADRLQQAMAQSHRRSQSLAVAYLDLDGFKAVNDSHGHHIGDKLLVILAQRIKTALREGDTLARIGGDEFVAVMVDLETAKDCEPVLARVLQAASAPVVVDGVLLQVSVSIGVTLYPQDESGPDQLMRHADQAMYQAKQAGKNRYHLFDVGQDVAVKTQRESIEHIRVALDRNEFVLFFQPKVNMATGDVIGVEALIRWQHPERGLLPPAAFLPSIEGHPISVAVGEWVIDAALRQMNQWHLAGLEMSVSVNIGACQLQRPDFVQRLRALLDAHPEVPPHRLELEILETSALEDMAQVSEVMRACQGLGVCFALDDFGTGYSSLTYLKRLSADLLKIDQSFVRDMLSDPDDLAIVRGVVGLAQAFRREVIAEGVETEAHGTQLLLLGCKLAQGYGISRPMPADKLQTWVTDWQTKAVWTA